MFYGQDQDSIWYSSSSIPFTPPRLLPRPKILIPGCHISPKKSLIDTEEVVVNAFKHSEMSYEEEPEETSEDKGILLVFDRISPPQFDLFPQEEVDECNRLNGEKIGSSSSMLTVQQLFVG